MAQTASKAQNEPDSSLDSGNASQFTIAQLTVGAGSSTLDGCLTHNRSIRGEQNDTANPSDLSLYQDWIPTADGSYDFNDSYHLSPWLPSIPQEAMFFNITQPSGSPEDTYWTEPGFASNLLDGSSWPTAAIPRDTTDGQLSPLNECDGEIPTESDEKEIRDEVVEDGGSKRRKRSTSIDQQVADMEEQRRVQCIIRNLERFENEQRIYGRQQLKAIKDGLAKYSSL